MGSGGLPHRAPSMPLCTEGSSPIQHVFIEQFFLGPLLVTKDFEMIDMALALK